MPTRVKKRQGQFPVRVSLNVTIETSEVIDFLERSSGENRGVIVRDALSLGLVVYHRRLEKRWRQAIEKAASAPSLERQDDVEPAPSASSAGSRVPAAPAGDALPAVSGARELRSEEPGVLGGVGVDPIARGAIGNGLLDPSAAGNVEAAGRATSAPGEGEDAPAGGD